MEYGISFLAGAVHKYYDDLQDNDEKITPLFMDTIKVLMVTTMTIMFIKSPSISAFFFILICIYYSLGSIDSDFWKACCIIPFITSIISYDQYSFLGIFDFLQRIVYILFVSTIMYFDDKLIPEETSIRKSVVRIGFIIACIIAMWVYKDLESFSFVGPFSFFLIGYLISNIIYHYDTLLKIIDTGQGEVSQEMPLETEKMNTKILSQDSSLSDSPLPDGAHNVKCQN